MNDVHLHQKAAKTLEKQWNEWPQLDNMGTVHNGYRKSNYLIIAKS